VSASNGLEAFDRFRANEFDIVLMDVHMPECDGICATEKIRQYEQDKKRGRTPIVALTASVLQQDRATAYNAGMDGFANKPINPSQLYGEMAAALGISKREPSGATAPALGAQVDFEHGELLWGSRERQCHEINEFIAKHKDSWTLIARLETYQTEDNATRLHTLKGAAGNLGLVQLARLLQLMEQATSADQYQTHARCLDASLADIAQTLDNASVGDSDKATDQSQKRLTMDDTKAICQNLFVLAQQAETDAELLSVLQQQSDDKLASKVEQLVTAFDDFEFEQAVSIITSILDQLSRSSADSEQDKL